MKITLPKLEELQAKLPIPKPTKPKYNGCLTEKERQVMADIYREAKLSRISKRPATKFSKYRPEF